MVVRTYLSRCLPPRLNRDSFYIKLPLGAVSAAIILFTFKTPAISRNEDDHNASWSEKLEQMDLFGTFTILAAVTCLLLTLLWGGVSKSWRSADVIGTFVFWLDISRFCRH